MEIESPGTPESNAPIQPVNISTQISEKPQSIAYFYALISGFIIPVISSIMVFILSIGVAYLSILTTAGIVFEGGYILMLLFGIGYWAITIVYSLLLVMFAYLYLKRRFMANNIIILILLIIASAIASVFWLNANPFEGILNKLNPTYNQNTNTSTRTMTESEAIGIVKANNSCTSAGIISDKISYNENSKTWWVDISQTSKPLCSPACVVNAETKEVEINWRCTGLTSPEEELSPGVIEVQFIDTATEQQATNLLAKWELTCKAGSSVFSQKTNIYNGCTVTVENGEENAWITTLEKEPLVKDARRNFVSLPNI